MDGGNSEKVKQQVDDELRKIWEMQAKAREEAKQATNPEKLSRRGKRTSVRLTEMKARLSEASGIDFDTEGQQDMDPKEIDESLMGLRAEIEPKVPMKGK